MDNTRNRMTPADALVIFGVTGDLAHKMIFLALYTMARRGVHNVTMVGVAAPKWSLKVLRKQGTDSIRQAGKIDDRDPLDQLFSLLRYVGGDYGNHHLTAQNIDQSTTDAPGNVFSRNNTEPMGCCGI
jgi:glucose-6-phosphate 1-dehydrogenase